jgi:flagellar operon protein
MSERLPINHLYPNTVKPVTGKGVAGAQRAGTAPPSSSGAASFRDILQAKVLNFSHHAELRLRQRGITFNAEQIEKINAAIDKAAAKGAKDSLVLIKDTALIVNVKNRTVVTAMDGQSLQDHVFTQIDSAVIIP